MADADKKTSSKGNIFKIVIIVFLAAVLLGGGTFAGYYVAMKNTPTTNKGASTVASGDYAKKKTFSLDDEFIVNLKSDSNPRFLKTQIYVGYPESKDDEKFENELKEKTAIMRDAIISVLRSKKAEDFSEAGIENIKKELINKINPLLSEGKITDIYFYEIIVQ